MLVSDPLGSPASCLPGREVACFAVSYGRNMSLSRGSSCLAQRPEFLASGGGLIPSSTSLQLSSEAPSCLVHLLWLVPRYIPFKQWKGCTVPLLPEARLAASRDESISSAQADTG